MVEIFVFSIIFVISYFGVEVFRRWSLRRELLDIPNERSSHTAPTPRGGGLVIVVISLTVYSSYSIFVTETFAWAYVVGASIIAGISWLDDLYSVSFIWRFLTHAFAALLIITFVGFFNEFYIPHLQYAPESKIGGLILTFFWIVWLTNAYNFMDGIDGIAGMQVVTAGIGWFLTGKLLGYNAVGFYGGVIASAGLGFLIQNWQPAKIFMGDVGSAFLGFTLAILPLLSEHEKTAIAGNRPFLPFIAIVLNWLFIFDTVFTVVKRALQGEKIWEAHRGHIYQQMVIAGFSHQSITILYGTLSILTVLVTICWVIQKDFWEFTLILLISFQSIGLLFCMLTIRRKRQ